MSQMQKPKDGIYRKPKHRAKKKSTRKAQPMLIMAQWYLISARVWGCRRWDLEARVGWIDGGWHWIIQGVKNKRVYAQSSKPTTRSRKARRAAMSAILKVEAALIQTKQAEIRPLAMAA